MKWFKREAPSPIVANPNPTISKIKVPWITKWVQRRKRYKLSQAIKKPKHIIKPLRKIRPAGIFYSSNKWKKLSGMKLSSYR